MTARCSMWSDLSRCSPPRTMSSTSRRRGHVATRSAWCLYRVGRFARITVSPWEPCGSPATRWTLLWLREGAAHATAKPVAGSINWCERGRDRRHRHGTRHGCRRSRRDGRGSGGQDARDVLASSRRPEPVRGADLGPRAESPRIRALQDSIDAEPEADHRLAALAERAAMSARSVSRQFVVEAGVTPAAYVEQARVDAAPTRYCNGCRISRWCSAPASRVSCGPTTACSA